MGKKLQYWKFIWKVEEIIGATVATGGQGTYRTGVWMNAEHQAYAAIRSWVVKLSGSKYSLDTPDSNSLTIHVMTDGVTQESHEFAVSLPRFHP